MQVQTRTIHLPQKASLQNCPHPCLPGSPAQQRGLLHLVAELLTSNVLTQHGASEIFSQLGAISKTPSCLVSSKTEPKSAHEDPDEVATGAGDAR